MSTTSNNVELDKSNTQTLSICFRTWICVLGLNRERNDNKKSNKILQKI